MHPDLTPLAFLAGTWRGEGEGRYPTIASFRYGEEVTFTAPPGKPFLAYGQKTWDLVDSRPLHTESGYLRPVDEGAEFVVAQPTGVVEIHTGRVTGRILELRATLVGVSPTAKQVDSVERNLEVTGDVLRYELFMGAVGQPHQIHLEAELHRI